MNDRSVVDLSRLRGNKSVVAEVAVLPAAAAKRKNVRRQTKTLSNDFLLRRADNNRFKVLPSWHLSSSYNGKTRLGSQLAFGPQGIRPAENCDFVPIRMSACWAREYAT